MKTHVIVVIAAATLLPAAVVAAYHGTPGTSPDYDRCIDKAQGVTVTIADCQTVELKLRNDHLNASYHRAMMRLPAARKASLRANEQSWIKRRDATCQRAAREDQGGSASGLDAQDCLISQTAKRDGLLKAIN